MSSLRLSEADRRILKVMQADGSLSRQELAERAGTSPSTLWRRVNELEEAQAIRKRVFLLDAEKVGWPICVFVSVNLVDHEPDTRQRFEQFVQDTPQIMECYSITGTFDYMMIIRAQSVSDFEAFLMEVILGHKSVSTASSQISLRQQKYATELPL